jgi:hypothetical protein
MSSCGRFITCRRSVADRLSDIVGRAIRGSVVGGVVGFLVV